MEEERKLLLKSRAWIEVNLDNLDYNIREIKKLLHPTTKVMAVVKAEAYGCGMVTVARYLQKIGIDFFAVATLEEGILLRKNGILGNILILGYTLPSLIHLVNQYDLIQTIVDYNYFLEISKIKLSKRVSVHIKINTGMNRIGEHFENIENISKMFDSKKLNVLGIYSHFCVADSKKEDDRIFSLQQIENLNHCVCALKKRGYSVGVVHMQSSYGLLNYNDYAFDYARVGIIMYGVHSSKDVLIQRKIHLKPVLTVKSRITSIKEIEAMDSVSYGRVYVASAKKKIASVSIGYADGYPRNLSDQQVTVKINGNYAFVIGRICMDQLMIDVTNIENIQVGDEVILMGEGDVSFETIAEKAGTITNELLSRLGARLNRVVILKDR